MCLGGEFWKLLCLGRWGTNDSLGGKVCQGRARVGGKWASSKTVSKDSTNTSCSLPTGCFSDSIYWITLQKMHISEYVWTCLKELATNTRKKILQPLTFLKTRLLLYIFAPYFKNKYFLEHLAMVTARNATKYTVLHQYEQYVWYNIGI